MGQVQATENILCPAAQSLETLCAPEPHMCILKVQWAGFAGLCKPNQI